MVGPPPPPVGGFGEVNPPIGEVSPPKGESGLEGGLVGGTVGTTFGGTDPPSGETGANGMGGVSGMLQFLVLVGN